MMMTIKIYEPINLHVLLTCAPDVYMHCHFYNFIIVESEYKLFH